MNRGFTVIELVVSIGIFAIMTALVVAKYGNFNQSTFLTDTAYDLALALHTAQNYGLSVKNVNGADNPFGLPYGIDFTTSASGFSCGSVTASNKRIVLFADADPATPDGVCGASGSPNDLSVTSYALTRGATIAPYTGVAGNGLCAGSGSGCSFYAVNRLDVTYTRPNPEAKICVNGSNSPCYSYAEISIIGTDGSVRTVAVRQNGQISVKP